MTPLAIAIVIGAGVIGTVLRYLVTRRAAGSPWPVLIVNVAASLVGGLAVGLADVGVLPAEARLAIVTGFAGGLSTFSTLSVESIQLVLARRYRTALVSVGANVVLGVVAAALGYSLARLG